MYYYGSVSDHLSPSAFIKFDVIWFDLIWFDAWTLLEEDFLQARFRSWNPPNSIQALMDN